MRSLKSPEEEVYIGLYIGRFKEFYIHTMNFLSYDEIQ